MRRRARLEGGVPPRLRRFDPEGWPGADVWERHGAWQAARDAWEDEHGDWPESLSEADEADRLVGPPPDEPFDPTTI